MSILFRPEGLTENQVLHFTTMTAAAVSEAIEDISGKKAEIKWVNDIYLDGKKLCGILVESVNNYEKMVSEALIIGIGVNLTESPAVTDSSVRAVSLSEAGYTVSRDTLCGEILREILALSKNRYDFSLYADEYRSRSVVLGRDVTFQKNGVSYTGTAENITPSGGLTVLCGDDRMTLSSGEISLRINKEISK